MTTQSVGGRDGGATRRERVEVRKTVGETDVYLFAGISGDFSPNHVDEEYMKATKYGRRIAHGALMVAYMSQASTKMCGGLPGTIVSYGYDQIRFPGAVFIGDTVTVSYEIAERDEAARKTFAPGDRDEPAGRGGSGRDAHPQGGGGVGRARRRSTTGETPCRDIGMCCGWWP